MLSDVPNLLRQITTFIAGRYNANRHTRPKLASAFVSILNQAHELVLSSADPERDLIDFLSTPHTDLDLLRACKEVLEHIGTRGT